VLAGGLPSRATRGIDDTPGVGGGAADAGESIVAGAGEFDVDMSAGERGVEGGGELGVVGAGRLGIARGRAGDGMVAGELDVLAAGGGDVVGAGGVDVVGTGEIGIVGVGERSDGDAGERDVVRAADMVRGVVAGEARCVARVGRAGRRCACGMSITRAPGRMDAPGGDDGKP
jgi:hypothetical protein